MKKIAWMIVAAALFVGCKGKGVQQAQGGGAAFQRTAHIQRRVQRHNARRLIAIVVTKQDAHGVLPKEKVWIVKSLPGCVSKQLMRCSHILAFKMLLPNAVRRYFWLLLLGLSGMVISMTPEIIAAC